MNEEAVVVLPEAQLDTEKLAALVFELASQLHAERARRLALETALVRAGVLESGWEEAFVADAPYESRCQLALDDAMERLMKIMVESPDPRTPLRGEAAAFDSK